MEDFKKVYDNVSNIDGLENVTILKTLKAFEERLNAMGVVYKTSENLLNTAVTTAISNTNITKPTPYIIGKYMFSANGLLFKIKSYTSTTIYLEYYTTLFTDFNEVTNVHFAAENVAYAADVVTLTGNLNFRFNDNTFLILPLTFDFGVEAGNGIELLMNEEANGLIIQNTMPYDVKEFILNAPTSATQGTLTQEEYDSLVDNDANYINFNNEIYRLADNRNGYIVYSHVGQDNTDNYFIKCITITISTLGWVLTDIIVNNIDLAHPIDSIYMSINSTSPAELFGGTWEQIANNATLPLGDSVAVTGNIDDSGSLVFKNSLGNSLPLYFNGGSNESNVLYGNTNSATVGSGTAIYSSGLAFNGGQADLTNGGANPKVYIWKRVG